MLGENSAVVPPDPISNSEVKRSCGDGSVGFLCESSSSPSSYKEKPLHSVRRLFAIWRLGNRGFHVTRMSGTFLGSCGADPEGVSVMDDTNKVVHRQTPIVVL